MRLIRIIIVLALLGSLTLNVIAITKWRGSRAIIRINGQPFSERDLNNYLRTLGGYQVKAKFVERILVEQEAKKQGVSPTDPEVEEAFKEAKERDLADQYSRAPWKVGEAKADLRQQLAVLRLRTKGIAVTPEEIQEEYRNNPAAYDTPNKARCEVALIGDESVTEEVKKLMEKNDPPVSPSVIVEQYKGRVGFLGSDKKFTFLQPLSGPKKVNQEIFTMQPKQVRVLPPMELGQRGVKKLVVRLEEIIPGRKADLNDPKTKEKITMVVALRRSKPWKEILSEIWANMDFYSEDPNDKQILEGLFFPDRAKANRS